jgi:hypothetical protein
VVTSVIAFLSLSCADLSRLYSARGVNWARMPVTQRKLAQSAALRSLANWFSRARTTGQIKEPGLEGEWQ